VEIRCRIKDLTTQNALLHEHLESITVQATSVRQAADADVVWEGSTEDKTISQLRDVIRHLRTSKEIVDVKLESTSQEVARVTLKLEQTERSLDEARAALLEVRIRPVILLNRCGDILILFFLVFRSANLPVTLRFRGHSMQSSWRR
jgi:nucleoprotein TPR